MTTVPLSQLSIDEKVNVRKANRGAEPIFTGSIRKRGVIQKLLVRKNGAGFKITDGGKRYDALTWLRDHNETAAGIAVTADYPVPVEVTDETDAVARETSLIVNIARADTHPVDRFERFSELVEDGATLQAIADTYGMPQREVEKALALGALHPAIRSAWRAGEIKAESAQAFTLAADLKVQAKVFEKLKKAGRLNSGWTIRQELKAEDQEIGHLLAFVGIEAYEERGGKVVARDLFEGKHVVSDTDLVGLMAKEKLQAECARLTEAGWGWAAIDDEMPNAWNWRWGKINPKVDYTPEEQARIARLKTITEDDDADYEESDEADSEIETIEQRARARAFGPKQMAKSGCVISISDAGELNIQYGVVKPDNAKLGGVVESEQFEERRRERVKTEKAKGSGSIAISAALISRLSVQLTTAGAAAIKKQPSEALNIAIAALLSNGQAFGPGVKMTHEGLGSHKIRGAFGAQLQSVRKMKMNGKLAALAEVVAAAFDFQCHNPASFTTFRKGELCDVLGVGLMAAAREAFDAEDYFNSTPKAVCLAAITEAINTDEARRISGKPKTDIAKFAIANVPKTGWLPPELRTAHYDGPRAKTSGNAPTKPKTKKRAKP